MKTYKGFKICFVENNKLYSSTFILSSIYKTEYKLNEWVEPFYGFGPLCVFDTYDQAYDYIQFAFYKGNYAIYSCEYIESPETKIWYPYYAIKENCIKELVSNPSRHTPDDAIISNIPMNGVPGTYYASRIKLLQLLVEITIHPHKEHGEPGRENN